jgi:hypothetical protein
VNDSRVTASNDQIVCRIRAEYLEMPGLRLTPVQAQRLWGLDEQTCLRVLESLTKDRFLDRKDNGTYARLTDGAVTVPPVHMVKAEIDGYGNRSERSHSPFLR